jgi:hypothetical protein
MSQSLSDILVLDFTTLLPGPLATLMLAESGAEVIKVERPDGEDMRRIPPHFDGEAAAFALLSSVVYSRTRSLARPAWRCRRYPYRFRPNYATRSTGSRCRSLAPTRTPSLVQ